MARIIRKLKRKIDRGKTCLGRHKYEKVMTLGTKDYYACSMCGKEKKGYKDATKT